MVQQFRELVTFAEGLSSIPNTYTVAHSYLQL